MVLSPEFRIQPEISQEKQQKKPEQIGDNIANSSVDKVKVTEALTKVFERKKEALKKAGINSPEELALSMGKKFSEKYSGSMDKESIERPDSTKSAREMMQDLEANPEDKYQKGITGKAREEYFITQIEQGNYPQFVREQKMATVEIKTADGGTLRIPVTRTRLAVGTDNDYVFLPCNADNANRYTDAMGYQPLTAGIFHAIDNQADYRLHMTGLVQKKGDDSFMTGNGFVYQTALDARRQLAGPPEGLVSGEGKVILPSRQAGRLRIAGAHALGRSTFIQPDSHPHNRGHEDYSQGTYGVGKTFEYIASDGSKKSISYEEAMRKYPQELQG